MGEIYPTLASMGINNPEQIKSYTLSNPIESKDVLKISYRRPSGSLLTTTRKYEFDRTAHAADPSSTFGGELQTYEISPILNKALVELDSIVSGELTREAQIQLILSQIEEIEKDFVSELASLRASIKNLS